MPRSVALAIAALVSSSAFAAPETYAIDPLHSFPYFSLSHLGMSTLMGRFDKMTGTVMLDRAAKTGSLEVKIPTTGVNTGFDKRGEGPRTRDEHLRSADFFNSAEFPDMTYKSTKFNFAGDTLESVEGNLTLLGVTKPVKLAVTAFKCGPNPFDKKEMCGADANAVIKRSDFGVKFGVPAIGDDVRLILNVEAYKQ